jgi:hypothetical protein
MNWFFFIKTWFSTLRVNFMIHTVSYVLPINRNTFMARHIQIKERVWKHWRVRLKCIFWSMEISYLGLQKSVIKAFAHDTEVTISSEQREIGFRVWCNNTSPFNSTDEFYDQQSAMYKQNHELTVHSAWKRRRWNNYQPYIWISVATDDGYITSPFATEDHNSNG